MQSSRKLSVSSLLNNASDAVSSPITPACPEEEKSSDKAGGKAETPRPVDERRSKGGFSVHALINHEDQDPRSSLPCANDFQCEVEAVSPTNNAPSCSNQPLPQTVASNTTSNPKKRPRVAPLHMPLVSLPSYESVKKQRREDLGGAVPDVSAQLVRLPPLRIRPPAENDGELEQNAAGFALALEQSRNQSAIEKPQEELSGSRKRDRDEYIFSQLEFLLRSLQRDREAHGVSNGCLGGTPVDEEAPGEENRGRSQRRRLSNENCDAERNSNGERNSNDERNGNGELNGSGGPNSNGELNGSGGPNSNGERNSNGQQICDAEQSRIPVAGVGVRGDSRSTPAYTRGPAARRGWPNGDTRSRRFGCVVCGLKFHQSSGLDSHVRVVHLREKRFECPQGCGARFGARGDVTRHVDAVHLRKRDWVCHICGDAFSRKSILTRHCSNVHRDVQTGGSVEPRDAVRSGFGGRV